MGRIEDFGLCCPQWAVGVLAGLLATVVNAQILYLPLVLKGEVFEDAEMMLGDISRTSSSYSVAFSPDGKTLASASSDGTVRLWNVAAGDLIRSFEGHASVVRSVAFRPDGKTLASASDDSTVRLWNVDTGDLIRSFEGHASGVLSVAFSPDGKTLASASSDGTVRLWNVAIGELIRTLRGHASVVLSVAFSPDGKTLASASSESTVRLWNVATGDVIRSLRGHDSYVLSVAFSPDGKTLASASEDRTVRLWNVATGELSRTLRGHASVVRSVAFSPNGKTLASASDDSTVRLWNVATDELSRTLEGHASGVLSVAFSPDGKTLASASDGSTVRLWNVDTDESIRTLAGHASVVRSVAFSSDGKTLASASEDRTVRLWNVDTGELIRPLREQPSGVLSVAFSPDGKTLASASEDRTARLWNVATGELIRTLQGHDSVVLSVAFSPDGKTLASASEDRTVRLWNVATDNATDNAVRTLQGHASVVLSVAFSPDGKTLASASEDRTVRLWNVDTGELIRTLQGQNSVVLSVVFSPDGKTFASAFEDSTVRFGNVATGELIRTLQGHDSVVLSVAFSPDGKTFASAFEDRTVRLWNIATGELIRTLQGHDSVVLSVAFSPDGKTLASSSKDRTVRLWNGLRTTAILIGGQRGMWIRCRLDSRCFRHDDGTLLHRRREDGAFEPVLPQVDLRESQLELDDVPTEIETEDGRSTSVTLTVRNTGRHRAFWLGVRRLDDPDDDPLVVALPWKRAFLDPGEEAELNVRVSTHSAYDHPVTDESTFALEITRLHGEPIQVPEITVRSRVPSIEWGKATWVKSEDSHSLTVKLTNIGNLVLPKARLTAQLSDMVTPLDTVDLSSSIDPGESIQVPFGLSEDLQITGDTHITVTVRTLEPPAHTWTFADQPIRPATPAWVLLATTAMILLVLGALALFNHPLVRQLTAHPSTLLRRPPPDLPKARTLLRLTGRLDTVLNTAEVERVVLDRAIDFWTANAEARVRRLAERLGVGTEASDDAEVRILPLGASFPLNLERCLLHQPPAGRPTSEVLARLKARPETRDQITLVIATNPASQDALHRLVGADLTTFHVVPSGTEMTELLLSPTPVRVLARIVASQVKRTHVSPYQTGGGVVRESIFFGRDKILAHVLNREPASYLVVGGRQLGKTSLLQAIRRRLEDDPHVYVRYLVLSDADLTAGLARSLGLGRAAGLDTVLAQLAESERRTLFLIDEADGLVRREHRRLGEGADAAFGRLRSLSEEGRCHFILTGFWNLYEAAVLDYGSPLRNFGETLCLEALEVEACFRLATEPMASMGLAWEEGAAARLVERTGRRANLIAVACNEIVKSLEPTVRTIGHRHVDAALAGKAVQDALEGWQRLAGEDESRLDRAVVYATVERESFEIADVLAALGERGADVDVDRLERSLRRLELAWIVGEDDGTFFYRVPLFVERVRRQDPSLRLAEEARKLG